MDRDTALKQLTLDDGRVIKVSAAEYERIMADIAENRQALARQRFSAIEHKAIGDKAFHNFLMRHWELLDALQSGPNPLFNATTLEFHINSRLMLSPGLFVALGGDFYGIPESPISGVVGDGEREKAARRERFLAAYQTLASVISDLGLAELNELRCIIQGEGEAILKGLSQGKPPNKAFAHYSGIRLILLSGGTNYAYGIASRYTDVPWMFFYSRYVKLATMNFDHFGEGAKLAFLAGYEAALMTARTGGWIALSGDDTSEVLMQKRANRNKALAQAFQQVLFACHFLTDLFASGHLRTPRRALMEYVCRVDAEAELKQSKVAGLLAKAMHDEDNKLGLWVDSEEHPWSKDESTNQAWQLFGDQCYFSAENKSNQQRIHEVVMVVLESVYEAFNTPNATPTVDIRRYLPRVIAPTIEVAKIERQEGGSPIPQRNHFPLFEVEQKSDGSTTVSRRRSLGHKKTEGSRKYDWGPKKTLLELRFWKSPDGEFRSLTELERNDVEVFLSNSKDVSVDKPGMHHCSLM